MLRRPFLPLPLLLIVLLPPAPALADGKTFTRSADYSAFGPVRQNEQRAAIRFGDGREDLLIAINYNAQPDDQGLWIFPVPGRPGEVRTDLLDAFPQLQGYDDRPWADRMVHNAMTAMRASQLYPLIADLGIRAVRWRPGKKSPEEAQVHNVVEKWGLRAETLTAPSVAALAEHLREAGLEVAEAELEAFQPYLNDEYVLIVVRIASRSAMEETFGADTDEDSFSNERRPCLLVNFPTERGYYPMRPTASYGNARIPVVLYVLGHVIPHADPEMLEKAKVWYYRQHAPDWALAAAFDIEPRAVFDYTAIDINASAASFTSDLTFEPTHLTGFDLADAIVSRPGLGYAIVPVLFLGFSYVSAGLAGLAFRLSWRRAARLGLLNILTLAGVIVAARATIKGGKADAFCAVFSFIFVALTVIVQVALTVALGRL